ncbi:uncharacterized protein LOC143212363 [Lasioglossum baleicum]|uniref:uncharacterized protein LOC143212363 n=1 Tax=Lasioglossum baleicum TaxID=434251 RepID=UPI003FCDD93A
MARVYVYERPVDSVLANVSFYEKHHLLTGVRVKQEPRDTDDKSQDTILPFANVNVKSTTSAETTVQRTQLVDVVNNKENELVASTNRAGIGKSGTDEVNTKKRKRLTFKSLKKPETVSEQVWQQHKRACRSSLERKPPEPVSEESEIEDQECDVCYLKFRTKRSLKRHTEYYRVIVDRTCDKCQVVCRSIDELKAHKLLDKCKVPEYTKWQTEKICCFCNRKFSSKTYLQGHVFHIHTELLQNIISDASETDENNETDTTKETDKISEPPFTERTNGHIEHPFVQNKEKSPADSPTKRMRQTTMTEFLSGFTRKEHVSPKKVDPTRETPKKVSANQSGRITENVKETPKKATPKQNGRITEKLNFSAGTPKRVRQNGTVAEFVSNSRNEKAPTVVESSRLSSKTGKEKKPFVQIHMGSDEMVALLHTKLKIEPENEYINPKPQNGSYNLRRVTRNSLGRPPSDVNTRPRIHRDRNSKGQFLPLPNETSKARSKEELLRAKFKCKDCKVNLVRCDMVVKTEIVDYVPSTPVNVDADDIEEVWRKKVKLKRTHVPLVRLNNLVKIEVNNTFQSSNRENNPEKPNASQPNVNAKLRRIFRCKVCWKYFSLKEKLYEHLKVSHMFYISSVCSAWYKSRARLLRHYLHQHCVMKRMECCVCFEKFVSPVLLKRHMGLHCIKVMQSKNDKLFNKEAVKCNMNSKTNSCGACGKQFWLGACLSEHQQVCHKMKAQLQKSQKAHCLVKTSPPKKTLKSPLAVASGTVTEQHRIKLSPVKNHPRGNKSPSVAQPKRLLNGVAVAKGYNIDNTITSKEKFSCTTCSAQFLTFQNLCLHERTFTQAAKYVCDCCNTAFTTPKLLKNHVTATHMLDTLKKYKYFCTFCTQGFQKKINLQTHTGHFHSGQTPIIPKPWLDTTSAWEVNTVCSVCNLIFESSERFIEHNMYYYKGQMFTCTFCNQTFDGMYMLNHHNKLVHYTEDMTKQYTYTCNICNEGFTQKSQHHAHKFHVHSAAPETSTQSLQDHTYAITVGIGGLTNGPTMKYNCQVCCMNFMVEEDLRQHQLEYSNNGDYLCSYCARKCPTDSILSKHESLSHTVGNFTDCYKCRYCEEVLSTCTALKCHEIHFHQKISNPQMSSDNQPIVNQSAKPPGNVGDSFVCADCSMKFVTLEKLNHHISEYSNVGLYSCHLCSRRFSELYRLEVHKLKHSNLNFILSKHHCPICREGFANPVNVQMHLMHFHKSAATDQLVAKDAQTSQAVDLNVEMASNSPSKTKSTMCPDCLVSYDSENALKRHLARFANEGQHACEHCGRRFQFVKLLKEHLKRHAAGIERLRYACSECDDRFGNPVARYQHIVHLHGKCKWKGDVPNSIVARQNAKAAAGKLCADSGVSLLRSDTTPYVTGKPIATASPVSRLNGSEGRPSSSTDQLIYAGEPRATPTLSKIEPMATANHVYGLSDPQGRSSSSTDQQADMTVAAAKQETLENLKRMTTYYVCPLCDFKIQTLEEFTSHLKLEHDGKIIQGTICDKSQSLTEGVISCLICGVTFTTEDDLKIHIKDAHVKICPAIMEGAAGSAENNTDAVQIVWEKKPDAVKLIEDQSDSEVHVLCSSYRAPIMNYDKTVANTESVDLSVDDTFLRIKDFAKLV